MGMVAVPLAVSVFTAAPAHAGAVIDPTGDPTDVFSTQAGFVLPWLVGIEGIGGSKGTLGGWAWAHSGPTGTQAGVKGVLQQTTHIGPAYFNLDVTKSAVFTYTPATTTTTTTPGGHGPCDHPEHQTTTTTGPKAELNLVDIGNWSAGIPGFVEWYGQLGFTSDTVVDENGVSFNWKGVNKQYVSIGGGLLTFGFDFQPSFAVHIPTPGVNLAAPLAPVLAPGSAPAGHQPAQYGAKSGHDTAKPGEDGAKPGEDGAKPGDVIDAAGYDGAKPGQEGVAPGQEGVTPGSGEGTSGQDGAKPGSDGAKPGPGDGTPGDDGVKNGHDGNRNGHDGDRNGHDGDKPREGEKPGQGSNNDNPRDGEKPGRDGVKPRTGEKPGQNSNDKSGQDGNKPGPSGEKSNQGGDKAGADAK